MEIKNLTIIKMDDALAEKKFRKKIMIP